MNLIDNKLYFEDIRKVSKQNLPWSMLHNKVVLVTGATGLIGHFLVDTLMNLNLNYDLDCQIIAIGRNKQRALIEFSKYLSSQQFIFLTHDINNPLNNLISDKVDFVIHLASNTHPQMYATEPINTITANIIGTKNLLDFCIEHSVRRFVFASSNEIYGENRGDVDLFDEQYCGYINPNTLRAGYPESKRCGEALCQAYGVQKGIEFVIPRFTRSYGPTMLINDTKAISQFIKNGIKGENIVLKSAGLQNYSYTYVADAVSGLLYALLLGKSGEAYNIADESANVTLKSLAQKIAETAHTKVIFQEPSKLEQSGYSKATKALLDGSKLRGLGWNALYDIDTGIKRTMQILKLTSC